MLNTFNYDHATHGTYIAIYLLLLSNLINESSTYLLPQIFINYLYLITKNYYMQDRINEMQTLSYILEKLRMKRQDNEFIMEGEFFTTKNGNKYKPENLTIIKTYRFEGESDPSDSSILYLIEANDGLIGYSMDAYGVYTNHDAAYDDFIRKIQVMDREEQLIFDLE